MLKIKNSNILSFLLRNPNLTAEVLSLYYPFTVYELEKYSNKIKWNSFTNNGLSLCNEEVFNKFQDKFEIGTLCSNIGFRWTEEFIEKHYTELFYPSGNDEAEAQYFSANVSLPWSEKFIEKYIGLWDWEELSANQAIPFTPELIDKFSGYWDYEILKGNSAIYHSQDLKMKFGVFEINPHHCQYCHKNIEFVIQQNKYKPKELFLCPNFNWDFHLLELIKEAIVNGTADEDSLGYLLQRPPFKLNIEFFELFEGYIEDSFITTNFQTSLFFVDFIKQNNSLDKLMPCLPDYNNKEESFPIYVENLELNEYDELRADSKLIKIKHPFNDYPNTIVPKKKRRERLNFINMIYIEPENAIHLSKKAKLLFTFAFFDEAIEVYNQLVNLSPEISINYNNLGFCKIYTGQYYDAILDFCKAIELDSSNTLYFTNRGFAKELYGDIKGARSDWYIALSKDPQLLTKYFEKGMSYYNAKRFYSSVTYFTKAIKIKDDYADAYLMRGHAKYNLYTDKNPFIYLRDWGVAAKLGKRTQVKTFISNLKS